MISLYLIGKILQVFVWIAGGYFLLKVIEE